MTQSGHRPDGNFRSSCWRRRRDNRTVPIQAADPQARLRIHRLYISMNVSGFSVSNRCHRPRSLTARSAGNRALNCARTRGTQPAQGGQVCQANYSRLRKSGRVSTSALILASARFQWRSYNGWSPIEWEVARGRGIAARVYARCRKFVSPRARRALELGSNLSRCLLHALRDQLDEASAGPRRIGPRHLIVRE
jgi:hypothetical protein